jgi:signal transduction histidine kinase
VKRGLFWRVYLHGLLLLVVVTLFLGVGGAIFSHRLRSGLPVPHFVHFGLLCGSMLLLLTLVSIPLVRQITRPLERLTHAVTKFGSGDLTVRSSMSRTDEVGDLARAFDDMAVRIERLVRSQKEFLANVSHELRTPLARVRVALEIAAEGDEAKARACLGEIGADLAELEQLVGDVLTAARLDLARGQAGSEAAALRRVTVAAAEIVEQSAARFRSLHPERHLSVEIEGVLPRIEADPALLRRALDNLLDNACAYSDVDRPVVLAARAEGDTLTVEIRDRGIGIAPADQAQLFTPFFRGDRSRARHTGGAGLGLALARGIVEAHGGTIGVESAPGEGTTFRIRIATARAAVRDTMRR